MNATLNTPKKQGLVVPFGYVMSHLRWNGSELVANLKVKVNVAFANDIGVFDFLPSPSCCVVYITESDLIGNAINCKRRIAKLRNALGFSEKYVIVDKNDITNDYFESLQEFVVLECNMSIYPTNNINQVVNFLDQIVKTACKQNSQNSFISTKQRLSCTDIAILSAVQKFPQVGSMKAKLLLEKFGSIEGIINASIKDLSKIVGDNAALKIHSFLTKPIL